MSVELTDNSIKVKAALTEATIAWLYEAAGEIEAGAKRNSRVDTGQLKNSWSYVVDEAEGTATIGSSLENAIWEEFGTGDYALEGNGRKGGWFYKDREGNGHWTHGKKPNRTLFRAFNDNVTKIKKRLESILKEGM